MSTSAPTVQDTIKKVWKSAGLPLSDLDALELVNSGTPAGTPSIFKVGHLAQTSVALAALAASSLQAARLASPTLAPTSVDQRHALVEFKSERFITLDGKTMPSPWGPIGGLHQVADGYIRLHDSFPPHALLASHSLGLEGRLDRDEVAKALLKWKKLEFEREAVTRGFCAVALRSEAEWEAEPQAAAISSDPVAVRCISVLGEMSKEKYWRDRWMTVPRERIRARPLEGVRVIELSRVIAAPVAGKTLAYHGADVIWITSPNLPSLPSLDIEFSRGKRSIQLDLRLRSDRATLVKLVRSADVFLQSYRPGALAGLGFSFKDITNMNPSIVYATLSAYGSEGPWKHRRGFDSLVQTVSGMNVASAVAEGAERAALVEPCQVLDHSAGYFLAFGIMAALRRRFEQPDQQGAWEVETSLAQMMLLLKSLGRLPPSTLQESTPTTVNEVDADYMDEVPISAGARMRFVRHSGFVRGAEQTWREFPSGAGQLGGGKADWK